MSEEDVVAIIRKMATKSCECDPIPTNSLKKILSSVRKKITPVMNLSIRIVCAFLEISNLQATFKKARLLPSYQKLSASKQFPVSFQISWEMHTETIQQPLWLLETTAWLPIRLPEALQLWDRLNENLWWHSLDNGEAKYHSNRCNWLECCVRHSWPWHSPRCSWEKNWHIGRCSKVVRILPVTKDPLKVNVGSPYLSFKAL